jgi:hypothetical protein
LTPFVGRELDWLSVVLDSLAGDEFGVSDEILDAGLGGGEQ